ncbi:hypothetical protein K439DRAFT_1615581 [Ramaria rubella]|nr:hypothetical protein K439DRAFT_1615581 [Ramaria rubella]
MSSSNIRYNPDTTELDREREGYIPETDESDDNNVHDHDQEIYEQDTELDEGLQMNLKDIPLYQDAILDVGAEGVSDAELMSCALRNAMNQDTTDTEGTYTVRRGGEFVNKYACKGQDGQLTDGGCDNLNHLLGSFPVLFPYGKGGFETEHTQKVSYTEHARWALEYND